MLDVTAMRLGDSDGTGRLGVAAGTHHLREALGDILTLGDRSRPLLVAVPDGALLRLPVGLGASSALSRFVFVCQRVKAVRQP